MRIIGLSNFIVCAMLIGIIAEGDASPTVYVFAILSGLCAFDALVLDKR